MFTREVLDAEHVYAQSGKVRDRENKGFYLKPQMISSHHLYITFFSRLWIPHRSEVPRPQDSISTLPCMHFKLLVSKLYLLEVV